jgi:hypothetical protein
VFGFSAFSAAPISSLSGGVVYDGAATIASTSAASCYAIRYAFGGATIVGVSTVSANGIRYAHLALLRSMLFLPSVPMPTEYITQHQSLMVFHH